MKSKYIESYEGLCHGTTSSYAQIIKKDGFLIKGDNSSWCGPGIYFYIDRSKAYWAAQRKCREINIKTKSNKETPVVINADIINIEVTKILDLRRRNDLESLNIMIRDFDSQCVQLENEGETELTEDDKIIILRSMYISFYCAQNKKELVIGEFEQRNTNYNEHIHKFAEKFKIVYGNELIYCAKNSNIISNIR